MFLLPSLSRFKANANSTVLPSLQLRTWLDSSCMPPYSWRCVTASPTVSVCEWHSAVFHGILSVSFFIPTSTRCKDKRPWCVCSNMYISHLDYSVLLCTVSVMLTQRILMTDLIARWKETRVRQLTKLCLLCPHLKVERRHLPPQPQEVALTSVSDIYLHWAQGWHSEYQDQPRASLWFSYTD